MFSEIIKGIRRPVVRFWCVRHMKDRVITLQAESLPLFESPETVKTNLFHRNLPKTRKWTWIKGEGVNVTDTFHGQVTHYPR